MDDLNRWRWLIAVIDAGGLKAASAEMHRTPSTISHAIKQLEASLGADLVKTEGRRLVLTEAGAILIERIRPMLKELDGIKNLAKRFGSGVEPELHLAVDQIVPVDPVLCALESMRLEYPETRIELYETVLGGGPAMLQAGEVDIYVGSSQAQGFRAEWLMNQTLVPYVADGHELVKLAEERGTPLTASDMRQHRQIVIRDSDPSRLASGTWLEASQRITVDHLHTALNLVERGLGFSWLPQTMVPAQSTLRRLPLTVVDQEDVPICLYHSDEVVQGASGNHFVAALRRMFTQGQGAHLANE